MLTLPWSFWEVYFPGCPGKFTRLPWRSWKVYMTFLDDLGGLHDLHNETSFECLARHQGYWSRHLARLYTDHIGMFIVPKVRHFLCLCFPWVPYDGVWQVVLLNPHLSTRYHIGDDVFVGSVYINPVCPFIECDDLPALLVRRRMWWWTSRRSFRLNPRPIQERDPVEASHLTPPHIRALEVSVEQHVEVEAVLLARVIHADVEVQLLLPEDDPVLDPEVMLPHGQGKVTVTQREDRLNVPAGQTVRALLEAPSTNSCESVLRGTIGTEHPRTELGKHEGNAAPDRFAAIENRFFAHE